LADLVIAGQAEILGVKISFSLKICNNRLITTIHLRLKLEMKVRAGAGTRDFIVGLSMIHFYT
jgi:hypothetical protein